VLSLQQQFTKRDGQRQRLIAGIFGIFGHGNVVERLHAQDVEQLHRDLCELVAERSMLQVEDDEVVARPRKTFDTDRAG